MSVSGVRIGKDGFVAADAIIKGGTVHVERSYRGASADFKVKSAVYGLPLEEFDIRNIQLPPLPRNELDEAVNIHAAAAGMLTSRQIRSFAKGNCLLVVSTPQREFVKPAAIVPEPVALCVLAERAGYLTADKKTMLIYIEGGDVISVILDGFDIVFMRMFARDEELAAELKLSAQSFYLREERTFAEIDRVVCYGDFNDELAAEVVDGLKKGAQEPEIIRDDTFSETALVIPAGLALFKRHAYRRLKAWNVVPVHGFDLKTVSRAVMYTAPLFPIVLLLYYYGDISRNISEIDGLQGRMASLRPRYENVLKLEKEVTAMERYMKTVGRDVMTTDAWYRMLRQMERIKPEGLRLTNLSGKAYGVITISGEAENNSIVTEFIEKLFVTEGIEDVKLLFTQSGDDGVDFQVTLRMKESEDI